MQAVCCFMPIGSASFCFGPYTHEAGHSSCSLHPVQGYSSHRISERDSHIDKSMDHASLSSAIFMQTYRSLQSSTPTKPSTINFQPMAIEARQKNVALM